jgi:hypothetical protein
MSVHPENISKDAVCMRRKLNSKKKKTGTLLKLGFVISQKPFLEASYKVAYWTGKQKKPHIIGLP